jgi:peptide/nickel transport system substrate-binding protein
MTDLKKGLTVLLAVLMACTLAVGVFANGSQEKGATTDQPQKQQPSEETLTLKPSETVSISGAQWSPPKNFNPFMANPDCGTHALVFDPLFHYNIRTGELEPWLAESGEWKSGTVYEITLRSGGEWTDGEAITVEDVVFTFEIAEQYESIRYSAIWDWLESVEAVDEDTVRFTFSTPRYHEWTYWLYMIPIAPEHVWSGKSEEEILGASNENGVFGGAYTFGRALDDKLVWKRNENWWGTDVFGKPAPKYVVYPLVYSNNVALGMTMKGEIDMCNNFLPGLEKIKDTYNLVTYYEDEPYNTASNVAVMFINDQKPPMDKAAVRRAFAFAIDKSKIVNNVYGGQVQAADPTGLNLLSSWEQYRDEDVVEEHGVSYDPAQARSLLEQAGVKDRNGDGFRENADGSPIELSIIVPSGWTDWMQSIKMISQDLEKVGIKARATFPDYGAYWDKLISNDYDMAINNFNTRVSSTPYTYWHCVGYDEIDREEVTYGNFGRYENEELFSLIDEFNETKVGSSEGMEIASRIQEILLEDMPSIPLWLNGTWSAASKNNWTNWPTEDNPTGIACGWTDYWQLGGLEALLALEPAE